MQKFKNESCTNAVDLLNEIGEQENLTITYTLISSNTSVKIIVIICY